MVSQSSGRQDSPVDPWEGVSDDPGDTDSLPSLLDTEHPSCPSDIRFTRHRAAWINPPCAQQQLQDASPQVLPVGNRESHTASKSPLGASPLPLGDSVVETSLSKGTVDSMGSSSARGAAGNGSDSAVTSKEERAVLPRRCPHTSLITSSKSVSGPPCPEDGRAFFKPSQLTASADADAVQVGGRTVSSNSFSPEAFILPVDVEKENAHFYVADMIISVMEKVKYNILSQQHTETWSTEEAGRSLGNDQADLEGTFYTHVKQESGSSASSDSGYEGEWLGGANMRKLSAVFSPHTCQTLSFWSNSMIPAISATCVIHEPNFNSAELTAKELYRVFKKCWMLAEVHYQLAGSLDAAGSIVVNEEQVQKDFESSTDVVQEIKLKSRIRGIGDWAPPRFQIIFNVHPPLKRDLVVIAQNFFCAGCGTPIEPKFVKRLRYCEYLGKYFCDCCHSYSESCIPARILRMWDFRKYYVSNFSKRLLDHIWHEPIFNLVHVSHGLYTKAKELDRVREIQEQLFHIKKLLKTCRFAESTLKEFEQLPGHLTEALHLFSLEDMVKVKKGLLAPSLKEILKASLEHVASCELCQGKGFICEFCRSTAVIFPFQTQCFQSSKCPRCARITARRRLLEGLPSAAT
uniref:Rubicon Homology domain-containing protein n=1 Tax=Capra hircus TaxID=9925 RepID=A0A8C2SCI7_CAPHI